MIDLMEQFLKIYKFENIGDEPVGSDQNGIFCPEMDSYLNWTCIYAEAVMGD